MKMKFRLIHSIMVVGVIILLICYSIFLTSSSSSSSSSSSIQLLIQHQFINHSKGDEEKVQVQQLVHLLPIVLHPPNNHSSILLNLGEKKKKKEVLLINGRMNSSPIKTMDIYEHGFDYPNPSLCPNDGIHLNLFIMIMSAPSYLTSRNGIRLTWAHYAQRNDISIAFLIGQSNNERIEEEIEKEKILYDDLIVGNWLDSYENLTLKTMATLQWIHTYCNYSQFILKTDDDMFINIPNLLNFISKIQIEDKKENKIYGRLAKKWKPVRNKKSKYYISFQQYKKTIYPDFTTGPAYLFSTQLASKLFQKGMETVYLKLEDVFTTGLLASELHIKRINIGDFANKKVNFQKTGFCALSHLISMHMVAFHEQFELWKKLMDGRTKCKIIYQNSTTNTKYNGQHSKVNKLTSIILPSTSTIPQTSTS